jgi:ribonuclease BN (tRNA processing enzyme)
LEGKTVIIKFVGTHNAESRKRRLVSFLIDDIIAVDAGSISSGLTLREQENIKAILISHGHYDHIKEIPTFAFNNSHRTTKIFAISQTLDILSSRFMDGIIYPNFTQRTSFLKQPSLELCPMEPFKPTSFLGYRIVAIPVNHALNTVGFEVTDKEEKKLFYTGDTKSGLSSVWENISPHVLVTEVTFPNRLKDLAENSGHLYPRMLKKELKDFSRINGYLPKVFVVHVFPRFEEEIAREIEGVAKELKCSLRIVSEDEKLVV